MSHLGPLLKRPTWKSLSTHLFIHPKRTTTFMPSSRHKGPWFELWDTEKFIQSLTLHNHKYFVYLDTARGTSTQHTKVHKKMWWKSNHDDNFLLLVVQNWNARNPFYIMSVETVNLIYLWQHVSNNNDKIASILLLFVCVYVFMCTSKNHNKELVLCVPCVPETRPLRVLLWKM